MTTSFTTNFIYHSRHISVEEFILVSFDMGPILLTVTTFVCYSLQL